MYERILAPTDGSDAAMRAVEEAIDLAGRFDATLHTVYAVAEPAVDYEGAEVQVVEAREAAGQRAVDEVRERAGAAGLAVETSVERGHPHRVVLDYADREDVDLVVLGTHGRTGLQRYLIGSVAEKVVRHAEVPVLTVQPEAE